MTRVYQEEMILCQSTNNASSLQMDSHIPTRLINGSRYFDGSSKFLVFNRSCVHYSYILFRESNKLQTACMWHASRELSKNQVNRCPPFLEVDTARIYGQNNSENHQLDFIRSNRKWHYVTNNSKIEKILIWSWKLNGMNWGDLYSNLVQHQSLAFHKDNIISWDKMLLIAQHLKGTFYNWQSDF